MNQHPLRSLLPEVTPHVGKLLLSFSLRTVQIFAGMALFALSAYMLAEAVLFSQFPDRVQWYVLIAIGILKAICRYAEQVSGHQAAFHILHRLREALFDGYARQSSDRLSILRSGDMVSRAMADVELVEIFFAHTLAPAGTAVLFIIVSGVVAGLLMGISGATTLVVAYAISGILIPLLFQRLAGNIGSNLRQRQSLLNADIAESLAGIQDLAAFSALEHRAEQHKSKAKIAYRLNSGLQMLGGLKDVLVDLLLVGSLVLLAWLGWRELPSSQFPVLWALIAGLAGGFPAVLGLNRAVDDLPKVSAAAKRIIEITGPLNAKNRETPHRSTSATAVSDTVNTMQPKTAEVETSQPPSPELRLESVSFHYESGRGVQDIDLCISPGAHIFITGQSGSGKSTLASIMLGMIPPQAGEVLLGDTPLSEIPPESRYRSISAARQNFSLIRGSAMDNIRLGTPVEGAPVNPKAMELPMIEALFSQLPQGEHTLVSGTDEQISGGQRRRLGLAASLARSSRILLLDEAFAGLDDEMRVAIRARVLEWAKQEGVSVVEFSHELTEGREADSICVLSAGKIIEQGDYEQLMQRHGHFWDLASMQTTEIP